MQQSPPYARTADDKMLVGGLRMRKDPFKRGKLSCQLALQVTALTSRRGAGLSDCIGLQIQCKSFFGLHL